jgi:hypothetical protein
LSAASITLFHVTKVDQTGDGGAGGSSEEAREKARWDSNRLWECDLATIVTRIDDCQRLHALYMSTFKTLKARLGQTPSGPQLNLSSQVFFQFDRCVCASASVRAWRACLACLV